MHVRTVKFSSSQDKGHVTFEFIDNSLCAEGFSFSRINSVEEFMLDATKHSTSFTSDYFFKAASKCSKGKTQNYTVF